MSTHLPGKPNCLWVASLSLSFPPPALGWPLGSGKSGLGPGPTGSALTLVCFAESCSLLAAVHLLLSVWFSWWVLLVTHPLLCRLEHHRQPPHRQYRLDSHPPELHLQSIIARLVPFSAVSAARSSMNPTTSLANRAMRLLKTKRPVYNSVIETGDWCYLLDAYMSSVHRRSPHHLASSFELRQARTATTWSFLHIPAYENDWRPSLPCCPLVPTNNTTLLAA